MQQIDLFSGIGGFSLAGEWMGWKTIQFCEINKFCQQVLKYYWKSVPIHDDIKTLTAEIIKQSPLYDSKEQTIITGGFPCQPYSVAGKRKGTEDDRNLWPDTFRLIKEFRPDWCVLENVPGIITWGEGVVFEQICTSLEKEGYEIQPFILPAAGVNAPHRRDRVWFVTHLKFNRQLQSPETNRWKECEFDNGEKIWNKHPADGICGITSYATSNGVSGQDRESIDVEGTGETSNDERIREQQQTVQYKGLDDLSWNVTDNSDSGIENMQSRENGIYESEFITIPQGSTLQTDNKRQMERKSGGQVSTDASNTKYKRLQRSKEEGNIGIKGKKRNEQFTRFIQPDWENFPTQSPLCSRDDGISSELVGITFPKHRNESIKAYGNAIVPQVVYQIYQAIEKYNQLMPKTTNKDERKFTCTACGLYQFCISKRMKPTGSFKKGIMFIGEAPGEMEDRLGAPFQGKTGQLLQRTCRKLGIDLFEDCVVLNAVNCRPKYPSGSNRTPVNKEIDCCRRLVLQAIDEYKPKIIILLGGVAVQSVIGYRWKRDLGTISKWRGWSIPDQDFKTWICPTFHPSFVERSDTGVEQVVWEQDLKKAFSLLEEAEHQGSNYYLQPFPVHKEPRIEVIDDLYMLANIRNYEVAFDYETTGLKPHAEGHHIICCAIAPSEDHAYVFMMPKTKEERKPFIDLLQDEKIGKIAQNMKFEHTWSNVRLKTEVKNWVWDTMIATHVFDNRQGITSLKFQVYVQFGIIDYSSDIAPFLQAKEEKNANSINRIEELVSTEEGKQKLLHYCGLDAVYEFRLAQKQRNMLLPF